MSANAEHSRAELYYVAEVTYGVTPSNPSWRRVRHTGVTVAGTPETIVSDELSAHRQVVSAVQGVHNAGGDVTMELTRRNLEVWFAAALASSFTDATGYTGDTVSFAASDNSLNDSEGAFPTIRVGDVISVTGSTSNNVSNVTVVSATASKIIVSGGTLVNEVAGDTVTIASAVDRCLVGTTVPSFSLLRRFTDLSKFQVIDGVCVNTLNVNVAPKLVTVTLGLLARKAAALSGSAPSGSTYAQPLVTAAPGVGTSGLLYVDGAVAPITELSFTAENGLAARFTVGSAYSDKPASGRFNVTGQLVAYFENETLLNKFLAGTSVSAEARVDFGTSGFVRFVLPNITLTGGQPDTQGAGPIMVTFPFVATYDTTATTAFAVEIYNAS